MVVRIFKFIAYSVILSTTSSQRISFPTDNKHLTTENVEINTQDAGNRFGSVDKGDIFRSADNSLSDIRSKLDGLFSESNDSPSRGDIQVTNSDELQSSNSNFGDSSNDYSEVTTANNDILDSAGKTIEDIRSKLLNLNAVSSDDSRSTITERTTASDNGFFDKIETGIDEMRDKLANLIRVPENSVPTTSELSGNPLTKVTKNLPDKLSTTKIPKVKYKQFSIKFRYCTLSKKVF